MKSKNSKRRGERRFRKRFASLPTLLLCVKEGSSKASYLLENLTSAVVKLSEFGFAGLIDYQDADAKHPPVFFKSKIKRHEAKANTAAHGEDKKARASLSPVVQRKPRNGALTPQSHSPKQGISMAGYLLSLQCKISSYKQKNRS